MLKLRNISMTLGGLTLLSIFVILMLLTLHTPNDLIKAQEQPDTAARVFLDPVPWIDYRYEKKIDSLYKQAMKDYNARHYHINDYHLQEPQIILVHCTHVGNLTETLSYFDGSTIQKRQDVLWGGKVNVGSHYIVDKDGTIYAYVPLQYTARHAVGLNYTAIGIENVATRNADLNAAQIASNVRLIRYLKDKFPTLRYLVGHHEYNDKALDHYKLVILKDKKYYQWRKIDPGAEFMRSLRGDLASEGMVFLK